ncbi:MAG: ABC transporter ATP-binding protein [bacterium]|nr:ABC transporter ATP-binding protein [bacterium]
MTAAEWTSDALHVADPTVVAARMSKWFGPKVAVSEVDCSFGPGVTGLLGPNGAGKTTFLRVLAGLLSPSSGEVTILGMTPRKKHAVHRYIGFVPEDEAVYGHMTARRFVDWSAAMSKVGKPAEAARRALETVHLTKDADRALATFSKGMRQRAKVAAALVHDPTVLLLDEPLNGTDPLQRARLIELFLELGQEGRTIIVSSHVLAEVERMAGRVVAMVDGRVAAAGTVPALRDAMSDKPRLIRIDTDRPRLLAMRLLGGEWVESVKVGPESVEVRTTDARALGRDISPAAREAGARITAVSTEDESLDSVFRYLVDLR